MGELPSIPFEHLLREIPLVACFAWWVVHRSKAEARLRHEENIAWRQFISDNTLRSERALLNVTDALEGVTAHLVELRVRMEKK